MEHVLDVFFRNIDVVIDSEFIADAVQFLVHFVFAFFFFRFSLVGILIAAVVVLIICGRIIIGDILVEQDVYKRQLLLARADARCLPCRLSGKR